MVVENYDKAHRSIIHFHSVSDLTKSMDHVRRTTLLQRIFQKDYGIFSLDLVIRYKGFFCLFFFLDGFLYYRHCLKRIFFIIEGFEKLKMASNRFAKYRIFNYIINYNDFKVFLCLFCHQIIEND